jgi:hypothetical protein
MGIPISNPNDTDEHFILPNAEGRKGRYIHGVGLNSTFLDYVFNGVTAQDIAEQCIAAYKYIVENYKYGEYEIWMFGLSRGAYTVRCLAGMINNCGIVKPLATAEETDLLCREVYRIYRSPYDIDAPKSGQSREFRKNASWPLIGDEEPGEPSRTAPVRFLGLLDTVGSLGIPTFTGGVGLEWPKFYDQEVSSAVEHVTHAVSLHDRLYAFQPCLALRNREKFPDPHKWNIHQKWFPGAHYDLGRQRFKFFRDFGVSPLETILSKIGWVSKVIEPNQVLSDLVLKWMLESIRDNDPNRLIIRNAKVEISQAVERITSNKRKIGSGEVYASIAEYAPLGRVVMGAWRMINGTRNQFNAIWQLLFALRDRHIPELDADVYDFRLTDRQTPGGVSIKTLAGIDDARYGSKALEAWSMRRSVSGLV